MATSDNVLSCKSWFFILVTFTISYYHFKKYNIILEKLIVKENSLVIQNINNDEKIIFNEEIKIFMIFDNELAE